MTFREFIDEKSWDAPDGKHTVGGNLLNAASARVRKQVGADFFLSYTGELSKRELMNLTGELPVQIKMPRQKYTKTPDKIVSLDYTRHFNNDRELKKR